jgi:opacity protein-like surface antigen
VSAAAWPCPWARTSACAPTTFPFGGTFRFTLGATSNQYKIDLLASGAGGTLTIGNTTYNTSSADQFRVQVKFPTSTPYFGLGWGHGSGSGLRFSFDLGASVGKATVSYQLSGPIASQASQADIDAELAELRNGVGKVKAIPQLTLGLGWSF